MKRKQLALGGPGERIGVGAHPSRTEFVKGSSSQCSSVYWDSRLQLLAGEILKAFLKVSFWKRLYIYMFQNLKGTKCSQ